MPSAMGGQQAQFVSRAGRKLQAALDAFNLDVQNAVCADFGANIGGFTDCLLAGGAAKVYAVDTGYGVLAWRLRSDDRVVVMERTNALYCEPPEPVDLVTIDAGWTPQLRIVPAALGWLRPPDRSRRLGVLSLLKPHYELAKLQRCKPRGALSDARCDDVCREVCRRLARRGITIRAAMRSPLRGKGGNREYALWIAGGP